MAEKKKKKSSQNVLIAIIIVLLIAVFFIPAVILMVLVPANVNTNDNQNVIVETNNIADKNRLFEEQDFARISVSFTEDVLMNANLEKYRGTPISEQGIVGENRLHIEVRSTALQEIIFVRSFDSVGDGLYISDAPITKLKDTWKIQIDLKRYEDNNPVLQERDCYIASWNNSIITGFEKTSFC